MGVVKSDIKMEPTIGRIVIFNMPDYLKNGVNGNKSDKLPAIIVAVWSETTVNLKIITDGQNDLWVTSASQGDGPNQWNWPVINK
jgi:hypothetical protein